MNLIFMGPPGAGKGTQAEFIKQNYPIPHISTGDMFREAVSKGTEMGMKAQKYMDEGKLVPDEVTIGVVEERLSQPDCRQGFLLDGFPRTLVQAEALDRVTSKLGRSIEAAIDIFVPDQILVERMSGRISCKECKTVYNLNSNPPKKAGVCDKCGGELIQRSDDKAETARKRLQVYQEETRPVMNHYQQHGVLYRIDGNRDSEAVFADIQKILETL